MKNFNKISVLTILVFFVTFSISNIALAVSTINLGTADNFAVLGGSTITNTGSTVVNGDLGLSPGTSIIGFPPGTVSGTQYITDGVAAQAQTDLVTAYNATSGQTGAVTVSGDLGGLTLTPGVYNSSSSLGLTGTLALDGENNPNSVFIFQVGSALTTASSSTVSLINGAQACNVFWQIGSSATLGTGSNFAGSLIAFTSVTANTGATISGRILARNGAVTLDTNSITVPNCTVAPTPPTPPTPITPTTPQLATLNIIKTVVNNSIGVLTASDFKLYVKLSGTNVTGSPASGNANGTSYSLSAGTYVVSEDKNINYKQSFSGDCDSNGNVTLSAGSDKTCTITNTDIQVVAVEVIPATIEPSIPVTPIIITTTPGLPKTGFPPRDNNPLSFIIFSSISMISIFLYFVQKKSTT